MANAGCVQAQALFLCLVRRVALVQVLQHVVETTFDAQIRVVDPCLMRTDEVLVALTRDVVRSGVHGVRAFGRQDLMRSMKSRSLCAESAKGSAPTKCTRSIATQYEPHACDVRDCEEGLDHRLPISSTMNGQGITLQDRCTWLDSDGFLGQ